MQKLYLSLSPDVFLKKLEKSYIYNRKTDSLYEINNKAWKFFINCDGSKMLSELSPPKKFLSYALEENLLALSPVKLRKKIDFGEAKPPSLRYLLIELTTKCNLSCRHCYLGKKELKDLSFNLLKKVLPEFGKMGGLRAIFSGGEPLLYPHFEELNEKLPQFPFRSILLTNGLLLRKEKLKKLNFQEIQISLDGMKKGHETLRGIGTFRKTLKAIEIVKEAGFDFSIATIIYRENLNEFAKLKKLIEKLKPTAWLIDVPVVTGNLKENKVLAPSLSLKMTEYLNYQFGKEVHEAGRKDICGTHLACLKPYGYLTKCGFYEKDWTGGSVWKGLEKAWRNLRRMRISELKCSGCKYLAKCKGGCRFRAEVYNSRYGPDPVKCLAYGLKALSPEGGEDGENQESLYQGF